MTDRRIVSTATPTFVQKRGAGGISEVIWSFNGYIFDGAFGWEWLNGPDDLEIVAIRIGATFADSYQDLLIQAGGSPGLAGTPSVLLTVASGGTAARTTNPPIILGAGHLLFVSSSATGPIRNAFGSWPRAGSIAVEFG